MTAPMGFRSFLVLAKLGFDLREHYDHLFVEPLPDEIRGPLQALAAKDPSGLRLV
jgi:hypothetical protein